MRGDPNRGWAVHRVLHFLRADHLLGALNSRFIVPSLFARAEVSAGRQLYKPASELRQSDYTSTTASSICRTFKSRMSDNTILTFGWEPIQRIYKSLIPSCHIPGNCADFNIEMGDRSGCCIPSGKKLFKELLTQVAFSPSLFFP